jgi:hypothetical protein
MELENCTETVIPKPQLSEELTRAHEEKWEQQKTRLERRIVRAKEQAEVMARIKLIAATEYTMEMGEGGEGDRLVDIGALEHKAECPMNLTIIQNELDKLCLQLAITPQPELEGEDTVGSSEKVTGKPTATERRIWIDTEASHLTYSLDNAHRLCKTSWRLTQPMMRLPRVATR